MSLSPAPFVPADFVVPQRLETAEFRLRMLTVNDVVKDYDAVMTSIEHLRTIWPESGWPDGLTFEQDLIDLGWHQKEFQTRRSFAYTVVKPVNRWSQDACTSIRLVSATTTLRCFFGRGSRNLPVAWNTDFTTR